MGLFSFLGKVAKAGLSVATRGVSDKVLAGVKALIGKPKPKLLASPDQPPTIQQQAFLNKAIQHVPRVQRTEVEGWGFGKARGGFKRKRAAKRKKTQLSSFLESAIAVRSPRVTITPGGARRKPAKPRSPRKAPTGGLDLKAIGAAWSAAGKGPGTGMSWSQFRAANSHLRMK